jgi:2-polyprenyl-3-methyl-5-hydroxy-6-metoxy-1,4-benzoquinol methylase
MAARAVQFTPVPPLYRALSTIRARLVDIIAKERRREIARVHAAWTRTKNGGRDGAGEPMAELTELAEELVLELRRRTHENADTSLARLAAHLDARLPTHQVEYMDRKDFSKQSRSTTLSEIDRWNRNFGSYVVFYDLLRPLLKTSSKTVSILDIASGHGGFPLALAELCEDAPSVRIIASDIRPEYLEEGRKRAREAGLSQVKFVELDALAMAGSERARQVDIVTCTQALHHFSAGSVALLLGNAIQVARRGILFVDLSRTVSGFVAFNALGWLGGLDGVFHHDAVLSMRRAFVPEELALIARCVPGNENIEAFYVSPGFAVLRTIVPE